LPPDWIGLTSDGDLVPITSEAEPTTSYGSFAPRVLWRIALDARWSADGRAASFLEQSGFLRDQFDIKGYVSAEYAHDGTPLREPPSTVGDAAAIGAFMQLEPAAASATMAGQLLGNLARDGSQAYWGDPTDLYTQEWGWYATALYANALPDLWGTP